jgi:hypothetical protein
LASLLLCSALVDVRAQDGANKGAQEPDPATRAAMLRATAILRIAAYIQPERAPATRSNLLRIGVVGDDAVTQVLQRQLAGKRLDGREVTIVVVATATAVEGKVADCDLLYIATAVDADTGNRIRAANADRPLALVSERPGFAAEGGSVQLFVKENFIRFEINATAMKRQGLRPDSQLLKLSQKGPR